MSLSHTFSSKYNDDAPIPKHYRSSVFCLERLSCSGISIPQLEAKFTERLDSTQDSKQSAYIGSVLDRVAHIGRIACQLDEDVSRYPPLYFPPGKLLDELNLLIGKKEAELLESKRALMNKESVPLCMHYLRGTCNRGVTCSFSHTGETLVAWLQAWLDRQTMDHGETCLSIVEEYGPDAWVILFDLIAKHGKFTSIILRNASRDALRVLTAAISSSAVPSLLYLDLGKNNIGDVFPRVILKLAKALTRNSALTGLCIGHNALGAAGALALAQSLNRSSVSRLTSINLQSNGISFTDPAFAYLCGALSQNTTLVKLGVACNDLGPEGTRRLLEACGTMQSLKFLDLGSVGMGDHGAAHVGTFLAENPVGRQIRYLNVSWNKLSHEGCGAVCDGLFQHPAIEVVRMHFNLGIGRKGAMSITELIKNAPLLHVLDLRWTSLGDDGAATLMESITGSPSLREVPILGNDLAPQTESLVLERLRRKAQPTGGSTASGGSTPSAAAERTLEPISRSEEAW